MNKNFIIAFLCFIYFVNYAQLNLNWVNRAGETNFYNFCNSSTIDANGNIYTTGQFQGIVDFDPGPGVYNLTTFGSFDIFVCKFAPNGNLTWAKQFGGGYNEDANSITVDASGNVYTTGYFIMQCDFDPGPGTYTIAPVMQDEIFISKLDASGNFIWAKALTGVGIDRGYSITVDAAQNVYTTGKFLGGDFDPGSGTFILSSSGYQDVFVSKLDINGDFVWAKHFGGPNDDIGTCITTDALGNVYTTGAYNGIADFDPGPGVYYLNGGSSYDIFVSKLDANGNFVWAASMGGAIADQGTSIIVDPAGNVYTAGGFTDGGADFDPGPGVYYLPYNGLGAGEIFISKLDINGNFVWAKSMGGISSDGANSIALDASGNVYTTGGFSGPADFDPGPAVYNLNTGSIFLSKLDANGSFVWAQNISDIGYGSGKSLSIDAANNIYVSGGIAGTIDFDPSPGVHISQGLGFNDIYVAKFCQMAAPTVTVSGPTSFCFGGSVILTSSAANSYSWSTGATTQSILVSSTGNYTNMVSNGAGCSAINIIPVVAYPIPTITVNSGSICLGNSFSINPTGASTYTISGGSSNVSPTITSSYSVTGTSTAGCVAATQAISNVTVNSLPLPTLTVNNGTICSGNSFTIIPAGAVTYTFSSGSAIVSPSSTTSYSVIGTNSAGCVSGSAAVSNITVVALPLPTITVNSGNICLGDSFTITPLGANTYTIAGGNAIVTPTTNATYTVVGTNTAGCVSSAFATSNVTVNPHPYITSSYGTICSGNSFSIYVTGASTYTYEGGNSIVTPTTSTSYTVIGTSAAGCLSSNTATSNITVDPTPTITAASNASVICVGQTATLTANSGFAYFLWSTNATTPSIIVSPSVTTSYTVSTYSGSCTGSIVITQSVDICTGIKESFNEEINIYPNPNNGKITIVSTLQEKTIAITNSLGQLIYLADINEEKTEIDLSKMEEGIYFVKVGMKIKKIIKK